MDPITTISAITQSMTVLRQLAEAGKKAEVIKEEASILIQMSQLNEEFSKLIATNHQLVRDNEDLKKKLELEKASKERVPQEQAFHFDQNETIYET